MLLNSKCLGLVLIWILSSFYNVLVLVGGLLTATRKMLFLPEGGGSFGDSDLIDVAGGNYKPDGGNHKPDGGRTLVRSFPLLLLIISSFCFYCCQFALILCLD